MAKNLFTSVFGITSKDTFFNNHLLLKWKFDRNPFASIEITDDGREILHVGNPNSYGHVVVIDDR